MWLLLYKLVISIGVANTLLKYMRKTCKIIQNLLQNIYFIQLPYIVLYVTLYITCGKKKKNVDKNIDIYIYSSIASLSEIP